MIGYSKAHTNIALIKYWGKKDEKLMLPMNNSISLTIDAFYSETWVNFKKELTKDVFILNDKKQSEKETAKVEKFLNDARNLSQTKLFAEVKSVNHVPTAAGLASSASGMAALAGSVAASLDLPLDNISLSRLARHGSGSACRSIYGGFAEWEQGQDDLTSYAVPLKENLTSFPLAMVFILINGEKKKISSREGMAHTVKTSAFYPGWLETIEEDLAQARTAIAKEDFLSLGEVTERNALKMHGTMLGANPPFTYFAPGTIKAMAEIAKARENGIPAFFTMDAGPNVKVLVEQKNLKSLLGHLEKTFPKEDLVVAFPSKGIEVKKENLI